MVAYVTSPGFSSVVRPISRNKIQSAADGKVRAQDLTEEPLYELTVTHPLIESADVTTLVNFYGTNKYATITIPASDGESYDCLFISDYENKEISSSFSTMRVRFQGNRV